MICPLCNVEMKSGVAIKPAVEYNSRYVYSIPTPDKNDVKIIECLKCSLCGYSDDLNLE